MQFKQVKLWIETILQLSAFDLLWENLGAPCGHTWIAVVYGFTIAIVFPLIPFSSNFGVCKYSTDCLRLTVTVVAATHS